MHYSMVKLPEKPMMPRLFDERVGYFTVRQTDYGQDEHRAPERRYITRWRLEKKDPNAALSEPVKPIVYYVDPATPTKWVPYIKTGIENWQPAFEAAGFKNAIIAKEAPSQEQDPDWSPEDARYSVIRWLPSTIENASGPHVTDPRTGEILESDIQYYHNVMNLSRDWYFLQVGPLDPRAQKLPLPDDLMGTLVEYVVAHEVGHTLGFQHNMKASATYPAEKVRDKEWLKTMGHTPTLMDYSRFNYVAQPEDKIDPARSDSRHRAIRQVGDDVGLQADSRRASTPDEEKKTLDEWARAQDKTPWLRFSTAGTARLRSGREHRSSRRCRRGQVDGAGNQEPEARCGHAAAGDDSTGRALRRSRRILWPNAGPVGDRVESRHGRSSAASTRSRNMAVRTACGSRRFRNRSRRRRCVS